MHKLRHQLIDHDLPVAHDHEQGYIIYSDTFHLTTENMGIQLSLFQWAQLTYQYGELGRASYIAITISTTLALALLRMLYIIFIKAFQYRMTQQSQATSEEVTPAGD